MNNKQLVLSPRMQQIALYQFEHPELTQTAIASHFGISVPRINQILNSERVLNSFPLLAKRKRRSLVPRALKRQEELMQQSENYAVAEKVSSQILEQAGVLEKQPSVVIHELRFKSTEELQAIVDAGKKISGPVIDAELI